jgi:hypothetical protein
MTADRLPFIIARRLAGTWASEETWPVVGKRERRNWEGRKYKDNDPSSPPSPSLNRSLKTTKSGAGLGDDGEAAAKRRDPAVEVVEE